MKKVLVLALGLVTAMGGFVDISDVVFASQAGAQFGYSLIWAFVLGLIGIMIYSEMSGRVAAVTKLSAFDIIRRDFPPRLSFLTLILSLLVTILTCAAEIGGVALIIRLLTNFPYLVLIVFAVIIIGLVCWSLRFKKLERLFGYVGLLCVIFIVVAIKSMPDWGAFASGLIQVPHTGYSAVSYWYFAIGLIAAALGPYEIYFYSSGGIEEKWKPKNLSENRLNSYLGYGLGGLVVIGLIVAAANVLLPASISPEFIGTPLLSELSAFGQVGVLLALVGLLFSIGGSAVETSFSAAYNLSQYAGWKWGRRQAAKKTPRFTAAWMIILAVGALIIMSGINPVQLTEYAVIFSVVVMPLTYYPILKVARDKAIMGKYVSGRLQAMLANGFFVLIIIVAITAIPLMILSQQGQV